MVLTMNKGMKMSLILFWMAIFVVVAGFFLLDFEHSTINIMALVSLIFSLLVSMFHVLSLTAEKGNRDSLFYKVGVGSETVIYQAVVLVSILFAKGFENNIYGFIFLQIIINVLLLIVHILIATASSHIDSDNKNTYEKLNGGNCGKPKRGDF